MRKTISNQKIRSMKNLIHDLEVAEKAILNGDTQKALALISEVQNGLQALSEAGKGYPHQLQVLDLPDFDCTRVIDPSTSIEYHYSRNTGEQFSVSVPIDVLE